MTQNINHHASHVFIPHLLPQTQTYRRPFPQPDCFSFSKYTANNNNREPLGKSEAMKNAEMTSLGQAVRCGRLRQDTLSLGTPKWLQASK